MIPYKKSYFLFLTLYFVFSSCSIQKQVHRSARQVIGDTSLLSAHVGISIYEPATDRYWYNYQGDKYFVPASNTKIPTCYAAMKYLGDSLRGLDYIETDTMLFIRSTADPTLLHRDFKKNPVFDFLKRQNKPLAYVYPGWQVHVYGKGWSWDDYNESYMPERSALPVYGNVIEFRLVNEGGKYDIKSDIHFFRYALNPRVDPITPYVKITRRRTENRFDVFGSNAVFTKAQIPFRTYENERVLEDTLKKFWLDNVYPASDSKFVIVKSHPADSVLKPMMHRSDNFFAEQILLMVSNELLGVMNDEKIIDTLLKTDFNDLPQRPGWADGSGLSRYNLFTPQSFVSILTKMKNEFGMERIKVVFPTGGEGTLSGYYKKDSGFIYAKTGTLSGVVSLSGYVYTKKNRLLLFSVLINNHRSSAVAVRRVVEKFILEIRNKY